MYSALAAALLVVAAPPAAGPEPLTLTATAFGEPVAIDLRDLPAAAAESALRSALAEIDAIQRLTSPAGEDAGGLAELNAAAGGGARRVDPRLAELLGRAAQFCAWSRGAHGPLGGRLYLLRNAGGTPALADAAEVAAAAASSECSRLRIDPGAGTAALVAGSRLDLTGFAVGFAVDRAVAVLREHGAGNARVSVGGVQRAFGPGADGDGWMASLPAPPALARPLAPVRLHDQALAVAEMRGGERPPIYLDQRSGRAAAGVVATVAVAELAVDAQALAVTMFITGSREGAARLGTLRPPPAVLWMLGGASGPPILTDFHWSQLKLESIRRRNARDRP